MSIIMAPTIVDKGLKFLQRVITGEIYNWGNFMFELAKKLSYIQENFVGNFCKIEFWLAFVRKVRLLN